MHHFTPSTLPLPLWNIPKAPEQIYVQGSARALGLLPHLMDRGLAIVGTRRPQMRTVESLRHWIREMVGTDLIIVSGFARGIDTVAHEAALAAGLPTVAILGSSLDRLYPIDNEPLRQRILENDGLLISEFAPGTETYPAHFLQRNRLIAAWSKVTWIVEAAQQSGALNTALWARATYDRVCLTTPCFPGDRAFAGNQGLLDHHHAHPFWGVHCLGAGWLELSNIRELTPARSRKSPKRPPDDSDVRIITQRVTEFTTTEAGMPIQQLFDWSLAQGWPPQRFFDGLKKAIQGHGVLDRNGLLLKSPTSCD